MPTTTVHIQIQIDTDLHSILKSTAELRGQTMEDFVIAAIHDAAQDTIDRTEVIHLSITDQEHFAQALLSPLKPTPALKRAFASHRKLLR